MIELKGAIRAAVERVRIRDDGAGNVTIDVPGHEEDAPDVPKAGHWTSREKVAWELTRAFLERSPERGDYFTPEAILAWRARAADDLALAINSGEILPLDLERYLEETKYV